MRPACQIKFASDNDNQITMGKVEEKVPLFEQSDDWLVQSDLAYNEDGQGNNGPFPAHIATTGKQLDRIMFSDNLKSVMSLELTSAWEENLTESHIRKKRSCNKLESECKSKGWSVIPLYVEVAARRHENTMLGMMSKAMGMKRFESKRLRLKCSEVALHCSYHIYQSCKPTEWMVRRLIQY